MLRLLLATTRYAAVGCTAGGIALLFSGPLQLDPKLTFFGGFCLPLGPLYFFFSSFWSFEKDLQRLQRMKDAHLIQQKEYDQLRRQALYWFGQRRYGGPGPEPGEGEKQG